MYELNVEIECPRGSIYDGETNKQKKSLVDQWSTNKRASKANGHLLKQPNILSNTRAFSTG